MHICIYDIGRYVHTNTHTHIYICIYIYIYIIHMHKHVNAYMRIFFQILGEACGF